MAEGFLAVDEILGLGEKLLEGLFINEQKVGFNLLQYAPFAATEGILVEAVKNGADRQAMHETLRTISLTAWQAVQAGGTSPMATLLMENQEVKKYVGTEEIKKLLDVTHHIGTASERAIKLVEEIKKIA